MTTWAGGPTVGFDTETTGVDPAQDRIVSAALVHRDATGTRTRTWLLDPGVEIPGAASAVHGITTARARAHGRPPRAALAEIAADLAGVLRAGTPVVAFNAAFDLTLLENELARHGLPTLRARLGRPIAPVLDPLVLDRALERYRPGKRRLTDLCAAYDLEPQGSLHTAEVDVVATLDLLGALVQRYPVVATMPVEQVHAWQAAAHRAWADGFNAWRRRQGFDGPGACGSWPLAPASGGGRGAEVRAAG